MNKVTCTGISVVYEIIFAQPACKNWSGSHSACSEGGRTGFPDLVKGGVGAPFMQLLSHLFLQFWSESVSQLGPLDLMPKLSPVRSSAAHISEVKLTLLRSFVRSTDAASNQPFPFTKRDAGVTPIRGVAWSQQRYSSIRSPPREHVLSASNQRFT